MRIAARLPLSWSYEADGNFEPQLQSIWLSASRRYWIHTSRFSGACIDPVEWIHEYAASGPSVVMRGCSNDWKMGLSQFGWKSRQTGMEALLQMPWSPHRSLRELERRALHKGAIRPVDVQLEKEWLANLLPALRAESHYQSRPALAHLFQTTPDNWIQALVYARESPLALVGWSQNGPASWHLEVLLRSQNAPVGTMEALILESARMAAARGIRTISLGEVPFLHFGEREAPHRFASYYLMRPAFSSMGLFRFKNKFRPRWEPLYLLSDRSVRFLTLADLFIASGCHRLLGYCLTHRS